MKHAVLLSALLLFALIDAATKCKTLAQEKLKEATGAVVSNIVKICAPTEHRLSAD